MKDIVSYTLEYMDFLIEDNNISVSVCDKYKSFLKNIVEIKRLDTNKLQDFVTSLNVNDPYIYARAKGELFGLTEEEFSVFPRYKYTLADLNLEERKQLLYLLLSSVGYAQNGNYVLIKYNNGVWLSGWTELSLKSRGKVIDLKTKEIVAYPFDKFFNLGENNSISMEYVESLLKESSVEVTDKLDGSSIIVTKKGTDLLLHTGAAWENPQVEYAYKVMESKHKEFLQEIPEGYTFVFELIHPCNKIVIDYGYEKDLYLIAVRDTASGVLLRNTEVKQLGDKYGFKCPESEVFNSIEDFMLRRLEFIEKEDGDTNGIKEGWVFRLYPSGVMFKLKYEQYMFLHTTARGFKLSDKKVYINYVSDTLDDFMSELNDVEKEEVLLKVSIIQCNIDKINKKVYSMADNIREKYNGEIDYRVVSQELKGVLHNKAILRLLRYGNFEYRFSTIGYDKYLDMVEQI